MTEIEYREKQIQDTNQLKKAFDTGYRKGWKEGIEAYERAMIVAHPTSLANITETSRAAEGVGMTDKQIEDMAAECAVGMIHREQDNNLPQSAVDWTEHYDWIIRHILAKVKEQK